jgi:hypothetical protein
LREEKKEERKEERKRLKRAKEEERKRAEDAKAAMKAEKQENAAQIPKSKGVSWHKERGKWLVFFYLDGKQRHGGYFDDHAKAVEAAAANSQ